MFTENHKVDLEPVRFEFIHELGKWDKLFASKNVAMQTPKHPNTLL